ncbi:hypothetical protein AB0F88_31510 [Streptosporangium sp. NPDC023963]|uniref:hypothetical protein n=1 Tax=Streptosporangium sp. NPDC023963 TaxID=3155608 RepID=UPI0034284BC1
MPETVLVRQYAPDTGAFVAAAVAADSSIWRADGCAPVEAVGEEAGEEVGRRSSGVVTAVTTRTVATTLAADASHGIGPRSHVARGLIRGTWFVRFYWNRHLSARWCTARDRSAAGRLATVRRHRRDEGVGPASGNRPTRAAVMSFRQAPSP